MNLPGYDAWKLASPPEIEMPRCGNCWHEYDDHWQADVDTFLCAGVCRCGQYVPEDYEPDPDEAYDRKREERYQ